MRSAALVSRRTSSRRPWRRLHAGIYGAAALAKPAQKSKRTRTDLPAKTLYQNTPNI